MGSDAYRLELEPASSALLVVDMTNQFVGEGSPGEVAARARRILPRLGELIDDCRSRDMLIAYTTQVHRASGRDLPVRRGTFARQVVDESGRPRVCVEGTDAIDIVVELAPGPEDVVIHKHRSSAFAGTDLDMILRCNQIDTILITGAATQGCCWAAALDAAGLDYRVVFVSDCTAAGQLPDTQGGVVTAEDAQRFVESAISFSVGTVASSEEVRAALRTDRLEAVTAEP